MTLATPGVITWALMGAAGGAVAVVGDKFETGAEVTGAALMGVRGNALCWNDTAAAEGATACTRDGPE
jgi:hypothetical protein